MVRLASAPLCFAVLALACGCENGTSAAPVASSSTTATAPPAASATGAATTAPETRPASTVTAIATATASGPLSAVAAPPAGISASPFCGACATPGPRGALMSGQMTEVSGLAASPRHPDVYFGHNDSGDHARFFALGKTGADLGVFTVEGAKADDWEDMDRGPCPVTAGAPHAPGGDCFYFADFGDNFEQRKTYAVYRVPEPKQVGIGPQTIKAESMTFTYADGAHNAETLLVHPKTGALTIVTKVPLGVSGVYELPEFKADAVVVATKVGDISPSVGSPRYTGGDVHPEGRGVLLRTYTNVFFYPMAPDQTVGSALAGPSCILPDPDEEQGETVAWLPSGKGYVTISEGVGAKVNVTECAVSP
jgi:hypothetical protein